MFTLIRRTARNVVSLPKRTARDAVQLSEQSKIRWSKIKVQFRSERQNPEESVRVKNLKIRWSEVKVRVQSRRQKSVRNRKCHDTDGMSRLVVPLWSLVFFVLTPQGNGDTGVFLCKKIRRMCRTTAG